MGGLCRDLLLSIQVRISPILLIELIINPEAFFYLPCSSMNVLALAMELTILKSDFDNGDLGSRLFL